MRRCIKSLLAACKREYAHHDRITFLARKKEPLPENHHKGLGSHDLTSGKCPRWLVLLGWLTKNKLIFGRDGWPFFSAAWPGHTNVLRTGRGYSDCSSDDAQPWMQTMVYLPIKFLSFSSCLFPYSEMNYAQLSHKMTSRQIAPSKTTFPEMIDPKQRNVSTLERRWK